MGWLGEWLGRWAGSWFGAQEVGEGQMSALLVGSGAMTGSLSRIETIELDRVVGRVIRRTPARRVEDEDELMAMLLGALAFLETT